jgi:YVTN family beta-propeller protein
MKAEWKRAQTIKRGFVEPLLIMSAFKVSLFKILFLKIKAARVLLLAAMLTLNVNAFSAERFPEDIFVTLKDSGELIEYGAQKTWKGEPVMLYNSITPDGQRLVVSSPKSSSIYVFDTATHKRLASIKVGKAAKGLKVSPDGKEVYVANEAAASVSVVSLQSYTVLATIAVGETPHNVHFSPDGQTAYVTLQSGAGLGVIDTALRRYVKVIATPGIANPHNLDISADGKVVYIRGLSHSVGILDLASEEMLAIIRVGNGHAGIDVAPGGQYLFTGAIADDYVSVIEIKSRRLLKKIKVGFGPHGVRSSKNGRWLYVAITAEDKMAVIDVLTLKVVKYYDLAAFPFWVAVKGNP